jgi:hypothetical protein
VGKFLLVVIVFAAAVYAVFWLLERRRAGGPSTGRTTAPRPQPRPFAPDDDERFLRDLGRKRRRPENPKSDPGGPTDGG